MGLLDIINTSIYSKSDFGQKEELRKAINAILLSLNGKKTTDVLQTLFAKIEELYVGYYGEEGSSYKNPSEGAWTLVIDNGIIYLKRYFNGEWSNVNKISFGLLVGTAVLGMIGCRGVIHPDADTSDLWEELPNKDSYLFDFEDATYTWVDQNDVQYGTIANNTSDDYKFGSQGYLVQSSTVSFPSWEFYTAKNAWFAADKYFAFGFWYKHTGVIPTTGGSSEPIKTLDGQTPYTGILIGYGQATDFPTTGVKMCFNIIDDAIYAVVDGSDEVYEKLCDISTDTWYFLYIIYDDENTEVTIGCDNHQITATPNTSWSITPYFRSYFNLTDFPYCNFVVDDFVYFLSADKVSPDLFVQHYLSGLPWSTTYSYADQIIKPASGGKIQLAGETKVQGLEVTGTISIMTGMIAPFACTSAPTGWLACQGQAVSRTTYSALFAVISTTWGSGDGSTTFNIPDLRGAFLRGTGSHGSKTMADGNAFAGPSVGSFENDQMQNHDHYLYSASTSGNQISDYPTRTPDRGLAITNNIDYLITGTNTTGASAGKTNTNPIARSYGTPRVGDETRPFSAGILYCIKV